jgi:hypothetical protein
VDRGQRKRLADICEKLGVALFAGGSLPAVLGGTLTNTVLGWRVFVVTVGLGLLGASIVLSKEQ